MKKDIKIAHIADVHVRPNQYMDEMQFTFDRLFESLKEKEIDLVVICGDFFHSKLTVSSEYFDISFKFFEKLSALYKTIIIPGNHDSALSNQGRLDAISPIIEAVNSVDRKFKIEFIKTSTKFSYDFIDFHHFSIYDEKNKWPAKESVDKSKINIALYHGAINKCIVDNGWISRGNKDDITIFDGFDFAFLGDIHKFQFLNDEKTVAYPGSLRQNNFGEDIDKGYLFWTISKDGKFTVEREVLEQKRYFFTLFVDSVSEIQKIGELPKDSRIRVRTSKQIDVNEEFLLKEEIVKRYSPQGEVRITPPDESYEANQSVKIGNLDIVHENIRDVDVQKALIEEFLKKKSCTEEEIKEVLVLDKKYHSSVDTDVLRDIVFYPLKLKWDNFFSYGKGNQLNFENIGNGLIGVFGNTGSGKSSIFDVLFFTLFNSIYKEGANKNGDYVNRKCKRSDASLEIGLNGGKFVIERGIKKIYSEGKDEPKIENSVDFYKLPKSDSSSLNGETGPDTNKFIRDIFGTKEDAEMLSHCSQFGLMSFIDAKGTKRKEILSKFFDLNVFDFKFDLASKDHKEIKLKLKDCNKIELIKQKNVLLEDSEKRNQIILDNQNAKKEKEEQKTKFVEELAVLKYKKEKFKDVKIFNFDYKKYEFFKNKLEETKKQIQSSVYLDFEKKSKSEIEEMKKISEEIFKIKIKLPILEKQAELTEKIPSVEECKTCCLAKDSFSAKNESENIKQKILEANQILEYYTQYKKWKETKSELEILQNQYEKLQIEKNEFEESKHLIEQNLDISKQISEIETKLRYTTDEIECYLEKHRSMLEKNAEAKARIELIDEKLKVESSLIDQDKIYNLYLEAMGKNGISYWIISKKLNLVTKLVNQILIHATSLKFSIEENEEEKSLKVFVTDEKGKRPIELSSGGEKTLVAIALRAALWKICLLPKMPILILDESLVFLDQEKYDSAIKLIKYLLQEYFDKIFIISHNEDLKRVVDNTLYIQTNKGFSFVEVK